MSDKLNLNSGKTTKNETIVVRVDSEMKRMLSEAARDSRREVSDYIRILIEDSIEGLRSRQHATG